MDALQQYFITRKFRDYAKHELIEILEMKINITSEHIKIMKNNYFSHKHNYNIISLFEKYGFVFTDDDYKQILNKSGLFICDIPKIKQTDELCTIAVKENGWALEYISEDKKTDKLCEIAVRQNGSILQHVPEDKKTDQLCEIAVRQNGYGYVLNYVPKNKQTYDLCKIAVQQKGWSLKYVPDDIKTDELCKIAVKQDGESIYFVPPNKRYLFIKNKIDNI